MKNIEGNHITATEVKGIKAIISAGLTEGRVGRTDYRIEGSNPYSVTITKAVTDWFGPKMETSTVNVRF